MSKSTSKTKLLPGGTKRSLKDLLLAMPAAGDDADFAREAGHGREIEL